MTHHKSCSVSIIMPVYNGADFVIPALESVKRQSYTDWHCIIVDDCSTDTSVHIIQDYIQSDTRFTLLQNVKNRGAGCTRNVGLEYAQSDYIAFLDADDVWEPEKLQTQVAYMTQNPNVAITYGVYGAMTKNGDIMPTVVRPPHALNIRTYMANTSIGFSTTMVHRRGVGDFCFNPHAKREDCELWMSLLARGHVAHRYSTYIGSYYRLHNTQSSANKYKMLVHTFVLYMTQPYVPKIIAFFAYFGYVFHAIKKRLG